MCMDLTKHISIHLKTGKGKLKQLYTCTIKFIEKFWAKQDFNENSSKISTWILSEYQLRPTEKRRNPSWEFNLIYSDEDRKCSTHKILIRLDWKERLRNGWVKHFLMTWYAICRTRFRELYTLELKWYYIRIRYQIYRESLKDVQEEWKIINIWMKDWHGMMISSPRSIAVNWSRSSIKWSTPKDLISFAFMVSILYTVKLDPPYVEQPQDKNATATSFHIDLCDSKRDWAVKI